MGIFKINISWYFLVSVMTSLPQLLIGFLKAHHFLKKDSLQDSYNNSQITTFFMLCPNLYEVVRTYNQWGVFKALPIIKANTVFCNKVAISAILLTDEGDPQTTFPFNEAAYS